MLKKLLHHKRDILIGPLLVGLLVCIRMFEDNLFYDPFLNYFKDNYSSMPLPGFNLIKLFFSLGFRYYLNSILSLLLLYLIFRDTKIIKFSIFLYMLFGTVLMIGFFFVVMKLGEDHKMILFYIRRFIIQPIFLILFIPAFYYQQKIK